MKANLLFLSVISFTFSFGLKVVAQESAVSDTEPNFFQFLQDHSLMLIFIALFVFVSIDLATFVVLNQIMDSGVETENVKESEPTESCKTSPQSETTSNPSSDYCSPKVEGANPSSTYSYDSLSSPDSSSNFSSSSHDYGSSSSSSSSHDYGSSSYDSGSSGYDSGSSGGG